MQNPIPKSDVFVTGTLTQVQDFIDALPSKERANASLVFMFALNACHALVQKELDTETV